MSFSGLSDFRPDCSGKPQAGRWWNSIPALILILSISLFSLVTFILWFIDWVYAI